MLQFDCLGVGNDLWLEVDMILVFLDIMLQHLQALLPQPPECPSKLGVVVNVIAVVAFAGDVVFFSLAFTRVLPIVFCFFRLRHGVGTCSISVSVGFNVFLNCVMFVSGVYSITKKVSYGQSDLGFGVNDCGLRWNGTCISILLIKEAGYPLSLNILCILCLILVNSSMSEQHLSSLVSSPLIRLENVDFG